jgi:hypothetical protein
MVDKTIVSIKEITKGIAEEPLGFVDEAKRHLVMVRNAR